MVRKPIFKLIAVKWKRYNRKIAENLISIEYTEAHGNEESDEISFKVSGLLKSLSSEMS